MSELLKEMDLDQQLSKSLQLYKQVKWAFYIVFILCAVIFVFGLFWMNIIAIATGVITALLVAMAYLGVIMVFDENIKELQDKINMQNE